MYLKQALKLAWANTTEDIGRLVIRCAGITFAVVLMFMQNGFRNALFDSNVRIARNIDVDFIVRTRTRFMLSAGQTMSAEKIQLAKNVPGVYDVQPIYIENIVSYLRKENQPARRLRVIAFDLGCPIFKNLRTHKFADALRAPGVAIGDKKSKSIFEFNEQSCQEHSKPYGELAGKSIRLVGCFQLGIDFSNDGNMIMSADNFAHYFPHRGRTNPMNSVDYGLVKCKPDADLAKVHEQLKQHLGPHVIVNTKEGFLDSERTFWATRTPIGLIFMIGTVIGFVVGLIICYQVLATDIGDHLGEFATIKAMGYPASFFGAVVVIQALFLAIISFIPGMLIALSMFTFVNNVSGLIMYLNFFRASTVLVLTMAMCVASGVFALRKLLSTDPANLF